MWFFRRKKLFLDTNAMEFARIKAILGENGIPYEVKTTVSEGVLARKFNSAAATRTWESYSKVSTQTYVYSIYVRPKDYEKAKVLAFSKK